MSVLFGARMVACTAACKVPDVGNDQVKETKWTNEKVVVIDAGEDPDVEVVKCAIKENSHVVVVFAGKFCGACKGFNQDVVQKMGKSKCDPQMPIMYFVDSYAPAVAAERVSHLEGLVNKEILEKIEFVPAGFLFSKTTSGFSVVTIPNSLKLEVWKKSVLSVKSKESVSSDKTKGALFGASPVSTNFGAVLSSIRVVEKSVVIAGPEWSKYRELASDQSAKLENAKVHVVDSEIIESLQREYRFKTPDLYPATIVICGGEATLVHEGFMKDKWLADVKRALNRVG